VGFANAVTSLMVHDCGLLDSCRPRLSAILAAVRNGRWDDLSVLGINLGLDRTAGLDNLPGDLDSLRDHVPLLRATRKLLVGYPDFTQRPADGGGLRNCEFLNEVHSNYSPGGIEVSRAEAGWARANILVPLNAKLRDWAGRPDSGFTHVHVQDATEAHGMCAGPPPYPVGQHNGYRLTHPVPDGGNFRWFRRSSESQIIQGGADRETTTGMLHPNEFGHRAIAVRLLPQLQATGLQP
jgi:hypothetical protein